MSGPHAGAHMWWRDALGVLHCWICGALPRTFITTTSTSSKPTDSYLTGCPRCDLTDTSATHNGQGDCPTGQGDPR